MIVTRGLGRNATQNTYLVSWGLGAAQALGIPLVDFLCVVQNISIIEAQQFIDACELGRSYA